MLSHDLLLSVRKPARYIDSEVNAVKKDLSKMAVKVCLCLPDIYEIGMSHHGLRVLYDLINKQEDCAAERVFSPWTDLEGRLRSEKILLSSLESGIPVKSFDILGFSLQYELCYTNVLNILSLSGIPLRAAQRDARYPLVIAGGVCCLNPEPMVDFVDCFVIGEAEEVILEMIEAYKNNKAVDRDSLLRKLSGIEGVYVPVIHGSMPGFKIRKRIIKDLEKSLGIDCWVVPYIEIVHDRLGIEIMRGCPHACRFCQARSSFYPLRIVPEEKILETARRLYRKTGYEDISLLSLSSSDHPKIQSLAKQLLDEFKDKGVSVSLPSIRARFLVGELSALFSTARKTSLTFAPEAGSERLRKVLNKNLDIQELFDVASQAYRSGYKLLKLYFMIGLPTETKEDLDAIADVCVKLSRLKKDIDGHPAQLNVSISNFVPKPHTAFQWQAMNAAKEFKEKQEYLKGLLKKERGLIHLKFHDILMSIMEGVLARGDRRLGAVIEEAFMLGAKFDAWDNFFNDSLWSEAFSKCAIDPSLYLKGISYGEKLRWDFVDVGIPKEFFLREAKMS